MIGPNKALRQAERIGYAVTGGNKNLSFNWSWVSSIGKGLWEVGKIAIPTAIQVGGQAYLSHQQYEDQLESYLAQTQLGNQQAQAQADQLKQDYIGQRNLIIAGGVVVGLLIYLFFSSRKK